MRSAATASPGSVLIAEIASAPASSTARATARTSPAAAVSLAMSGRSVARRTAATTDARRGRVQPEHARPAARTRG